MAFDHSRLPDIALLSYTQLLSKKWLRFCLLAFGLITGLAQAQIPLRATQLSTGSPACALTNAGGVTCWGPQYASDTSQTINRTAVNVPSLETGVIATTNSCALLATGTVKCWGSNSANQLGTGNGISSVTPVTVPGLSNVVAITSGSDHNCALLGDGRVKCWGSNERGQLGVGITNSQEGSFLYDFTDVQGLSGAVAISAGIYHSCALLNTGGVKCWGDNSYNQLGIGLAQNDYTAKDVYGLNTGVQQLSVGGISTCAVMNTGTLKCWGYDTLVADGRFATDISGFSEPLRQVSVGYSDKCAIANSGALSCWGSHYGGAIIDSAGAPPEINLVAISGLNSDVAEVSVGSYNSCARQGTTIKCWGANYEGQLGNNSDEDSDVPVTTLQAFAPYIGAATAGNGQAIVHFTPPLDDSGAPITGYTVTATPAGGTDLYAGSTASYTGASDLSHLITGLVNGTSYRFTVAATNALGTGLPSKQSNAVIPTAPVTSSSSSRSSIGTSSSSLTSATTNSATSSTTSTSSARSSSSLRSSATSSSAISSSRSSSSRSSSTTSVSSSTSSTATQTASCTYVVSNQWNTGFTAAIRITNTGATTINGWSVAWQYNDGSLVTSGWNSTMTGSNPYSATNLNWNGTIAPGQTVEFGVQGTKANGAAASTPVVAGALCR